MAWDSCNACELQSMNPKGKQAGDSKEEFQILCNKGVHMLCTWCVLSSGYWALSGLWLKDFFKSEAGLCV